ncbi:nucleotidyl transferase AbiEii/AbiGii toxin family protein [Thermoactinospora rubra]|uniref:nucleotidyl transferase AbiEii/AbiGii toxin family protein n=1 Tax=Thermoactinospora rubra TaxID=1088767 RepID=UPI00118034D8|nr:nucleotidyl transferase AbiEii/AbiGii toxin family protein [Thermoactinospora rubra]
MRFAPFHQRILEAIGGVAGRYGLMLCGGHSMRAHGFTDRPSKDLDFAVPVDMPLPEVAEAVAAEFRRQGFAVRAMDFSPRWGRMLVVEEVSGQECEVDLMREALLDQPLTLDLCQVVGQDDAVGLKVRALQARGLPRDFIDVAAVADLYAFRELERLGRLHDDEWSLDNLLQRLEGVDLLDDDAFLIYGITEERLHEIRRFAYAWVEDIKLRRAEEGDIEYDAPDIPDVD